MAPKPRGSYTIRLSKSNFVNVATTETGNWQIDVLGITQNQHMH